MSKLKKIINRASEHNVVQNTSKIVNKTSLGLVWVLVFFLVVGLFRLNFQTQSNWVIVIISLSAFIIAILTFNFWVKKKKINILKSKKRQK